MPLRTLTSVSFSNLNIKDECCSDSIARDRHLTRQSTYLGRPKFSINHRSTLFRPTLEFQNFFTSAMVNPGKLKRTSMLNTLVSLFSFFFLFDLIASFIVFIRTINAIQSLINFLQLNRPFCRNNSIIFTLYITQELRKRVNLRVELSKHYDKPSFRISPKGVEPNSLFAVAIRFL